MGRGVYVIGVEGYRPLLSSPPFLREFELIAFAIVEARSMNPGGLYENGLSRKRN